MAATVENKGKGKLQEYDTFGIPMDIKYNYTGHKGADNTIRLYPKIETVSISNTTYDLTDILDYQILEQIEIVIYMELNKNIYN